MRTAADIADTDLGHFLSRPILIHQLDWGVSSNPNVEIFPWELFFQNPRVMNRLTTFSLLRGKLMIKIVVNGNSFYSGRVMVSYNPMSAYDYYFSSTSNWVDNVRLSQRSHVMVDPTLNIGGVIEAPFMWPEDYFHLMTMGAHSPALGSLTIRTVAPLRHANDATTTNPVSISIFVWMENVELCAATNTDISGLVPQSGDEYGSKVSNIVATANKFVAPFINIAALAPYVRATELILSTTESVAKILGFSRPCVIEAPSRYVPCPVSSLAVTEGGDTSNKLTLDPKQEVSIDPHIWGCSEADDMALLNVAKTKSLIGKFEWSTAMPGESMIGNMLVDPCLVPDVNNLCLPAVGSIALPFDFWSGNLKFTIEIVASQFHKGRFAVVYDPTESPAALEMNTNYIQVLDISEQKRVCFDIGNMKHTALRRHFQPGADSFAPISTTRLTKAVLDSSRANTNVYDDLLGNGTLSIWVINPLTTPKTGVQVVDILIYVEAGDDFRVYSPCSLHEYSYLEPQSGIDSGSSNPVTPYPEVHVLRIRGPQPSIGNVYCGEHVHSLRTLLKRYCRYLSLNTGGNDPSNLFFFKHPLYPLNRYYDAGAKLHNDNMARGVNFVHNTYLAYLRPMYAILRGSCRYKIAPGNAQFSVGLTSPSSIVVSRVEPTSTSGMVPSLVGTYVLDATSESTLASSWLNTKDSTLGSTLALSTLNSVVEFEVPYYTHRRFVPGPAGHETHDNINGLFVGGFQYMASITGVGASLNVWTAAGEDLSLGHFFGQPRLVYWASKPTPSSV
jgi:hypothetical protein